MRCILTTIFEIFICCTLYKLFTIMEHAESSRGRTQVEMLASFSQQYSKEIEQDTFTFISISYVFYRPAIYNRLRARRGDHSWPQRDFDVSVLRQLEWLFQTWQTADIFVLDKPQQEYGSKMPRPLTDSSWTPNVKTSHWQHLHSFISPPSCSSYR